MRYEVSDSPGLCRHRMGREYCGDLLRAIGGPDVFTHRCSLLFWHRLDSVAGSKSMAAWYGILLALSLGLKHNGSVRVDVFSQRWSERKQALVGIGGIIIFYCRLYFLVPDQL